MELLIRMDVQTEYHIPENSKRETLTMTITAKNENSELSKLLQVFSLDEQSMMENHQFRNSTKD